MSNERRGGVLGRQAGDLQMSLLQFSTPVQRREVQRLSHGEELFRKSA